jgi:argininosuccinate lyase
LILVHLSRLAEDFILYSSTEFGFLELSDVVTTGSSIMPQKKNPDSLELIRGKSGRVFGHLITLLTVLKGLPLAYNKDLQEDKEVLFDTVDTLGDCLQVAQTVVKTLTVNKARAQQSVATDFLEATDLADYLVRKGMPFRKAHALVGQIVLHCEGRTIQLRHLSLGEFQSFSSLIEQDVFPALSVESSLQARSVTGGTARSRVVEAIEEVERRLSIGD